ncbi:MAG: hypothetical protein DRP72_03655 [Candidatus Omnitrophota bacterium]|nr:MAG: hypothetical protein DRP72_03655 [Candidatus Omnitrophota bacterium]
MNIEELLRIVKRESPWQEDQTGSWYLKDGALKEIIAAERKGYYEPPKSFFFLKGRFFEAIHKNPDKFGILIIRGPRRVGKTSTLKYLIKYLIEHGYDKESFFYISLDEESLLDTLEKRRMLREFLSALIDKYSVLKPIILVLDEVTFYKGWARALKNLVDSGDIGEGVGVIATGSYSLDLSSAKSELKGRLGPLGEAVGGDLFFPTRRFVEVVESLLGSNFKDFIKKKLGKVGRRLGLLEFLGGFQDKRDVVKYDYNAKIEALLSEFYSDLHGVFEIYKYSGGYPRSFSEALSSIRKKGEINVSDARYKDDIYDLFITDCRKFKLDEKILQKILLQVKSPSMRIAANLDTLLVGGLKKGELSKYIEYLEASGLFMLIPSVSNKNDVDLDSQTIIPNGKVQKFIVTDPAVFLSLYYCSRNIVDIYKKASSHLSKNIQELLFEAIVISHLRFLPVTRPFLNIAYVLEDDDEKKELADALVWYVNFRGEFISLPIEVKSGLNIDRRMIANKARELKDKYGLGRLIVVTNTEVFEITDEFIMIPIEIFLLLF